MKKQKKLKNSQNKSTKDERSNQYEPPAPIPPLIAWRLPFLSPPPDGSDPSLHYRRELPIICSGQQVHHSVIALIHVQQLGDVHVLALACSAFSVFSHDFPEHFLLVLSSAAVAEEMFPCLGNPAASAPVPPAFVVVSEP